MTKIAIMKEMLNDHECTCGECCENQQYLDIFYANTLLKKLVPELVVELDVTEDITQEREQEVREFYSMPEDRDNIPVYMNDLLPTEDGGYILVFEPVQVLLDIGRSFETRSFYLDYVTETEDIIVFNIEEMIC